MPYGRGFLYLLDTDAEIRARSHGKHSLDDVVLEIYRRGTTQTEVTYMPRGDEVPGYGWERNPRAAEGTCKF